MSHFFPIIFEVNLSIFFTILILSDNLSIIIAAEFDYLYFIYAFLLFSHASSLNLSL